MAASRLPSARSCSHSTEGLFAAANALPVNGAQTRALRLASSKQWQKVEPANLWHAARTCVAPDERHKLRRPLYAAAYVERLVLPTVIEPLREEWQGVRTAAVTLANRGELKKAIAGVRRLSPPALFSAPCSIRPAARATSSMSPRTHEAPRRARCSTCWAASASSLEQHPADV